MRSKTVRNLLIWIGVFVFASFIMTVPSVFAEPTMTAEQIDFTKFQTAVMEGNLHGVKALLDKRPEFANKKISQGVTALHLAASYGYKDVVELLISKGADVNAADDYGNTPLDLALKGRLPSLADVLRAHGAHE